jgi:putative addiction module component (TIGR02574 family)
MTPQSKLSVMSTNVLDAAKNLPLPERLELLDALWESIIDEGYDPPLTAAQAEEIDRRVEAHRENPDDVIEWETIKTEINGRFGRR